MAGRAMLGLTEFERGVPSRELENHSVHPVLLHLESHNPIPPHNTRLGHFRCQKRLILQDAHNLRSLHHLDGTLERAFYEASEVLFVP